MQITGGSCHVVMATLGVNPANRYPRTIAQCLFQTDQRERGESLTIPLGAVRRSQSPTNHARSVTRFYAIAAQLWVHSVVRIMRVPLMWSVRGLKSFYTGQCPDWGLAPASSKQYS